MSESMDFHCRDGFCNLDLQDDLWSMPPPPPIPFFWNVSIPSDCSSLCDVFIDSKTDELQVPTVTDGHQTGLSADSVVSVVGASILGLTLGALMLIFVWYKKFGSDPSSLPPSLPSSSCETEYTCPVVNGKSPQSIIINHRGTIAYSNGMNQWRRGTDFSIDYVHRGLIPGSSVLHQQEQETYAMRESCTSSPVYAELDPTPSISPYAVGMVERPHDYGRRTRQGYYYTQPRANF